MLLWRAWLGAPNLECRLDDEKTNILSGRRKIQHSARDRFPSMGRLKLKFMFYLILTEHRLKIMIISFTPIPLRGQLCYYHAISLTPGPDRSSRPLNTQLLLEISVRIQWKTSRTPTNQKHIKILRSYPLKGAVMLLCYFLWTLIFGKSLHNSWILLAMN